MLIEIINLKLNLISLNHISMIHSQRKRERERENIYKNRYKCL